MVRRTSVGQVFIPQVPLDERASSRPQPAAPSETSPEDLGPPVDLLPARVHPEADGVLALGPGLYLVDTDLDTWNQVWPVLIEQFGKRALLEVSANRGMVLATFRLDAPARTSLVAPIYEVEPDDATLRGIARRMGYEGLLEPESVLEWASRNFPNVYQRAVSAAQALADVGSGVNSVAKAVAVAVGIAFLVGLIKRK